jgi:hypothetical protein
MDKYQLLTGVAALLLIAAAAVAIEPSIAYSLVTALPVQGTEYPSPADRVELGDIAVSDSGVTVTIPGAVLYAIADTNSMDPAIDKESTVLAIRPASESELIAGDIVIYRSGPTLIIHRLVETGTDSAGWYAIPKGDSNASDDGKVRFSQIEAVVIGIFY